MILIAVISLGAIGAVGAVFLYAASKKFEVYEDPRIAQVQEVLPGANCGGCGYPGCAGFAGACVKADSLDGLLCPVGGGPVMAKVATILGKEAGTAEPMVAVVRCNGTCQARPRTNSYDGTKSCAIASTFTERDELFFRLPRLWRLRERLRFRRHPHQPGYGNRRGRRGKMYFLWCLCEGLPEEYHRAKKERT